MRAIALCFAFFLLQILICNAQVHTGTGFWIQELSAKLTPGQLVSPCQSQNSNRGAGGCIINRGGSPTSIRCEIVHTVEDFVDITIQEGAPGSNGRVIHHFTESEFFGFFRGEIVRSTWYLTEDDNDVEENSFLNGNWFVLITSDSCPNGALRGQFTSEYNIASLLRGFNEVPPISSPDQGYALGYYNPDPSSRTLETFIEHTLQEATTGSLNRGAALTKGEEIDEYLNTDPPITGNIQLNEDLEDDLYAGNLYFNIRSQNFPSGEIRDQLHVIDAIPAINYGFVLDSSQLVPQPSNPSTSKGYAIFSVNCDTAKAEYMIVHNVPNPQTVELYFGADGEEGIFLHVLNGITSPIMGNITLSSAEYVSLLGNNLYIQIRSEEQTGDFPIIRGQIVNQYNYYAYISGTQEVPIVTTAAKGLALLNVNSNDASYVIHHDNVNSVQSVRLFDGMVGVNGDSITTISSSSSSTITGSFSLGGNEATRLFSGETYISISSSLYPSGEIRGQVYSMFGVCSFPPVVPPPEISVVENSPSSSSEGSVNCEIYFLLLIIGVLFAVL